MHHHPFQVTSSSTQCPVSALFACLNHSPSPQYQRPPSSALAMSLPVRGAASGDLLCANNITMRSSSFLLLPYRFLPSCVSPIDVLSFVRPSSRLSLEVFTRTLWVPTELPQVHGGIDKLWLRGRWLWYRALMLQLIFYFSSSSTRVTMDPDYYYIIIMCATNTPQGGKKKWGECGAELYIIN